METSVSPSLYSWVLLFSLYIYRLIYLIVLRCLCQFSSLAILSRKWKSQNSQLIMKAKQPIKQVNKIRMMVSLFPDFFSATMKENAKPDQPYMYMGIRQQWWFIPLSHNPSTPALFNRDLCHDGNVFICPNIVSSQYLATCGY